MGQIDLDALGYDNIDEWGRVIPDPDRFPSSRGGKGFSEIARKVHGMGLKFGIHCMRGISAQAVNAKTPILDVSKVFPFSFCFVVFLVDPEKIWFAKIA